MNGAPGGTRTPDLRVRNPALYPAELRARNTGGLEPMHLTMCGSACAQLEDRYNAEKAGGVKEW